MNPLPKIFVSIGLAADERQLLAQGRVLGVADGGGTSGEMRVCNFLLWQISYAEFVITPTLWPDFRKPQLIEALEEYARRHRRFGGI